MFGSLIYFSVLIVNAIAILNEERFLARSKFISLRCTRGGCLYSPSLVGWTAGPQLQTNTGFANEAYDQDIGVKARLINLIGAVRTLLRSAYPPMRFITCTTILMGHAF